MAAPKDNNFAMKWKTPEERQKLCDDFCAHLAEGFSIGAFPDADHKTIKRYARDFPEDFPAEKLEGAARRGRLYWEKMGKDGAEGKIEHFNATAWIFNMKNRVGWKDRTEIESWSILGGMDDAKKLEKMKPRTDEEIALGVLALLSRTEDDDSA